MFNFIALLLVIALTGVFSTLVELCGDHLENWIKGKLK
jgi:hypothetical protein